MSPEMTQSGRARARHRQSRPRRFAGLMALVAVGALVAAGCRLEILDNPSLVHQGTITTRPFAGSSTYMSDAEGMAYIPDDGTLWLADDNNDKLYEIDAITGTLISIIDENELADAPRLGGGPMAGSNRTGDLEAIAYDPANDWLYVFSGECCDPGVEPTAFRLTRTGPGQTFEVETWQPLIDDYTAATASPTGELYIGEENDLHLYDYVANTVGGNINISGMTSDVYGMGFSEDGEDLFIVGTNDRVYRADWATKSVITDYDFSISGWIDDGRAVDLVGDRVYIIDGDDTLSESDPLKHAIHLFTIDGDERSTVLPVPSFTATPMTGTAPLTVSFDASASFDPDGSVVEWYWVFGDGTPLATGETINHDYVNPGDYTAVLTVEDDAEHLKLTTLPITVTEVNVAPTLDPVGDQTIDELVELAFTATASDPNLPAQTLTYTLENGTGGSVPPGAAISAGGDFTWTPTEAQGPGTYTLDVVVTDDGAPVLEDRETIEITVDEVP